MLFRIHQSGHLAELSREQFALVKEDIDCHLVIVEKLKDGLPFWPLGLGSFADDFLCVGIDCGDEAYLAIWHTKESAEKVRIPIQKTNAQADCIYPAHLYTPYAVEDGCLSLRMDGIKARLFQIR